MTEKWPKLPVGSMRYATVGIEFIGIFLIFLGLGIWLDGRWDITPWMTMAGMVLGFGAGFYRLIQVCREVARHQDAGDPAPINKNDEDGRA